MSDGRTPYTETEFLLDILEDRPHDALARIADMHRNERESLLEAFEAGVVLLSRADLWPEKKEPPRPAETMGLIGGNDLDHGPDGFPL